MNVTIGNLTFDTLHYDAGGDVLYLHGPIPRRLSSSMPRARVMHCASTPLGS